MATGVEQNHPEPGNRNSHDEHRCPDYGFWNENLSIEGAARRLSWAILALFRRGGCNVAVAFVPLVIGWIATELISHGENLPCPVIVGVLLLAAMCVCYGIAGMVYRGPDHGRNKQRNEDHQAQAAEHPDDDGGAGSSGTPP